MAQNIDELALDCNILLEKLIFLCRNSAITKEQFLDNSRLKVKFLLDNIENISSPEIRSEAINNLNQLIVMLPLKERESWFYRSSI